MQKGIIKNVNRLTGEPVDAQDLASIFTGIVGNESGVLTVFDELRLEKISDNKVRLHSGVYSLKGHMLYIPKGSYEDFEIDSGTLGANRIDLLVAEYIKNGEGEGEDTLQFRIIKGETTSGTAQAPQLTQQDINSNGLTRQEAIYHLTISGTTLSIIGVHTKIKTSEYLSRDIKKLNDGFADIKDYVVSSDKGVERYKSGKVIQEGSVDINWETSKPLENTGLYYGTEIQIPFQRQFGVIPHVYFDLPISNTLAWVQLRGVTSTSFYFIVISPFQYTSLRKDKVSFKAIGR